MTVTIADVQQYLRLPTIVEEPERQFLASLIASAEEYIRNTTGKAFEPSSAVDYNIYNLAVKMLVAHWYDYRGAATDKPVSDLPYTLACLIDTLGLSSAYE